MYRKIVAVGSTLAALSPLSALAGGGGAGLSGTLVPVIQSIIDIVSALVPFMLTLAVLFFLWGLAKFVLAAGDEGARESGRSIMIWGVIAITVMVSLWGLVTLLQTIFNIDTTSSYTAPTLPVISI